MVDVSAAIPNTSRSEIRQTLRDADPNIARWIDQWLEDRNISIELDGHQGSECYTRINYIRKYYTQLLTKLQCYKRVTHEVTHCHDRVTHEVT
jgi:hypothetical protein